MILNAALVDGQLEIRGKVHLGESSDPEKSRENLRILEVEVTLVDETEFRSAHSLINAEDGTWKVFLRPARRPKIGKEFELEAVLRGKKGIQELHRIQGRILVQGAEVDFDHPSELKLSRIRVPDPRTLSLPEVDHDFIKDCLHLEDCEPRVAAYHRSMFHFRFAGEVEQAVQNRDLLDQHIREVGARIGTLSKQILKTDELVRQEQEVEGTAPWSTIDLITGVGLGLFSTVLLGMGVNTLATYLMDSGFIIFVERPALAYLLSAVNIGLAILLKVGSSWCRDDVSKHRYFVSLWKAGLFSGALWLVSFATIFPNIGTQGIDEIIASIGHKHSLWDAILEGIFVCSQLISEICISAALWIHLERMAREHAPALVMVRNPEHRGYLRCLSEGKENLRSAVEKRALLVGRLKTLQALEDAYLSKVNSVLKAGLTARQAERYGLDLDAAGSFKDI